MPRAEKSTHSEVTPPRKTPLTARERKVRSVARKRETHSAINVFIHNSAKQRLDEICKGAGLTLSEAIERLIENSSVNSTENSTENSSESSSESSSENNTDSTEQSNLEV